jgi:4-diphosphocytidyl-2-C-methyl-D-erythritol kinase
VVPGLGLLTSPIVIKSSSMPVTVRSFAKINLGLCIGPNRPDGFHELRTIYHTIALHDIIRVEVKRGSGIEIICDDPRVPRDSSNTCWKIADLTMAALKARGRVVIEIQKRLPVQGGLGGASGNAVSVLLALERAVKKPLNGAERLHIATEVGSDLPLFLVGGTVLGVSHGEEVYPLPDLSATHCVIATPNIGVSTPKAFADWDKRAAHPNSKPQKLTAGSPSDRINSFSRMISAWLSAQSSGVPVSKGRGRVETPLLDLVRTGIENDFERVVFPQYPKLRQVKRFLERNGAIYASLSGSGSALYGFFGSRKVAEQAAARLSTSGTPAVATTTLTRRQYWKKFPVSSS